MLAVLPLVLLVYIVGSVLLLGRERTLAIQELDQMSELYTSELDSRFLRISRHLFSVMMEKDQPTSVFWNYVDMMDGEYDLDYPLVKLRETFFSSAWEYGQEYCLCLYLEDKERYFRVSIDSEGSYIGQEDVEQAVLWQIEHLKDAGMSYSVKKKWNIIASGGENYMCKIAQNQGVYLGCYVNVKSILEPFSNIIMGKNGYVCLVNEQGESVGMLTSQGILDKEQEMEGADRYSIEKQLFRAPFSIRMKISGERIWEVMMGSVVVLTILAALLIAAGVVILIYLKRNILEPVQRFTHILEQYDSGDEALHVTEESLLELERIDDKFRNMIYHTQIFGIKNIGSPLILIHRQIFSRPGLLHHGIFPTAGMGAGALVGITPRKIIAQQAPSGIGDAHGALDKALYLHLFRNMPSDFAYLFQRQFPCGYHPLCPKPPP